jgi:hypothetical protein
MVFFNWHSGDTCNYSTGALGRLREEGHWFEASLTYIVRPCLKAKQNNTTQNKIKQTLT